MQNDYNYYNPGINTQYFSFYQPQQYVYEDGVNVRDDGSGWNHQQQCDALNMEAAYDHHGMYSAPNIPNQSSESKIRKPLKWKTDAAVYVPSRSLASNDEAASSDAAQTRIAEKVDISATFENMSLNDQRLDAGSEGSRPCKPNLAFHAPLETSSAVEREFNRIDFSKILVLSNVEDKKDQSEELKKIKKIGINKIKSNVNENVAIDAKDRFLITQKINGKHKKYKFPKAKPIDYSKGMRMWLANEGTQKDMQAMKQTDRYKDNTDDQIMYDRICHTFPERIDALLQDEEYFYQVLGHTAKGVECVKKYLFIELEIEENWHKGVLEYFFAKGIGSNIKECFHRRFNVIKDRTNVLQERIVKNLRNPNYIKVDDDRERIVIRIFKDVYGN